MGRGRSSGSSAWMSSSTTATPWAGAPDPFRAGLAVRGVAAVRRVVEERPEIGLTGERHERGLEGGPERRALGRRVVLAQVEKPARPRLGSQGGKAATAHEGAAAD